MLETPTQQDEYLRSLMPDAKESEIAEAKEAIADFLQLIWDMREERWNAEKREGSNVDEWRPGC